MKTQHNKKTKKIIGLIGENSICKEVSNFLVNDGFYKTTIESKVLEVSKYLMRVGEEINEAFITQVRNRGYQVNRLYWINLVLTSIPEDKNLIVIEDLRIEDIINDIVSPYYIIKNTDKIDCPNDVKTLIKPNDSKEFKAILEKEFRR